MSRSRNAGERASLRAIRPRAHVRGGSQADLAARQVRIRHKPTDKAPKGHRRAPTCPAALPSEFAAEMLLWTTASPQPRLARKPRENLPAATARIETSA